MEETVEDLPNTTTTTPSSSSNSKETEKQEKKVIISDDILHDFLTFLTRVELGQNFSLVSRRFRAFAYPKMHVHNAHWVEGECHFLTSAAHTTMVVPRGDVGGFEAVSVPSVPLSPNVLGFRGKIHFSGLLTDTALAFFRNALPRPTTLYRFSWLEDFYRTNGMLSPYQTSERFTLFLESCVQLVEVGGEDAFVSAFLKLPSMRRIRALRATKFREMFLGWLQQPDGEWRQLQVMRKIGHTERNRLIKLIFQDLNGVRDSASSAIRFCVRMSIRNWGDPVERLPLRWLRNSRTGQCVVLVERRPVDNVNVELCIVRCPCSEAEQRGFLDNVVTMDDLAIDFGWEESVCTVDVMPDVLHNTDTDDDGNNAINAVNETPLHQFF